VRKSLICCIVCSEQIAVRSRLLYVIDTLNTGIHRVKTPPSLKILSAK